MAVKWTSHGPFGRTATVYAPTEADADWEVMALLVDHPGADFGPVHPAAAGGYVAHGHGLVGATKRFWR